MQEPPLVSKDDPIRASYFNTLRAWLRSFVLEVTWPLRLTWTRNRAILTIDLPEEYWITIVANSGAKYKWQQVVDTAGGGWTNVPGNQGTWEVPQPAGYRLDPAYEVNGVTTIPVGTKVFARRSVRTGDLRFQLDLCS